MFISRLGPYLVAVLLLAVLPGQALAFKDLPANHWAAPYVAKAVSYEVISGYDDDTFRGNLPVNRYVLAKTLTASLQYIEKVKHVSLAKRPSLEVVLTDVKPNYWAYPYIIDLISQYQVIVPPKDGKFSGNTEINRYQMSVLMANALANVEEKSSSFEVEPVELADVAQDHWANKSVQKLISAGILSKPQDGKFNGKDKINRFTLSIILSRFIEASLDQLAKQSARPAIAAAVLETKPKGILSRFLGDRPPFERASLTTGLTNLREGGSATDNWNSFCLNGTYQNDYLFKVGLFPTWPGVWGRYEVKAGWSYNWVNYILMVNNVAQG
ncbi:MAG: S-layer homology domain-containing protein, partial [bacterium]